MSTYGFPDICGFYDMLYGTAGVDLGGLTCLYYGGASGIVWGGNPPYFVTDFIQIYPKFIGPPTVVAATLTAGNPIIPMTTAQLVGMAVGQLVVNLNAPALGAPPTIVKDTLIISVGPNSVTLSNPPLYNDSSLTVYQTPFLPIIAILTYINLALASVMIARYDAAWMMMMSLFVAHYSTLYMRTESGVPNLTASQVASSGLTKGIIVSRAAGDVSASSRLVLEDYMEWGAWAETQYGELFITIARATNCGPIYVP